MLCKPLAQYFFNFILIYKFVLNWAILLIGIIIYGHEGAAEV